MEKWILNWFWNKEKLPVIHVVLTKMHIHVDINISLASLFQHENSN